MAATAAAAATVATCFPLSHFRSSLPPTSFLTIKPLSSPKIKKIIIHPNKISSKLFGASSSNSKTPNDRFFLASVLDSLLVFGASLAISLAVSVADVGPALAFVVTTPRKLQADELATVRLFQENTPSVVYITNLAVRSSLIRPPITNKP